MRKPTEGEAPFLCPDLSRAQDSPLLTLTLIARQRHVHQVLPSGVTLFLPAVPLGEGHCVRPTQKDWGASSTSSRGE